jgi:PIN domain nuclease of toxin-antitoxin system
LRALFDTHWLLWIAAEPARVSAAVRGIIENPRARLYFSAISIWEIAIKRARHPDTFQPDATLMRDRLTASGWQELAFTGEHGIVAAALPMLHRDPFDRALVGQAIVDRLDLFTADRMLGSYGAPVQLLPALNPG